MSDADLRELERAAAGGDAVAEEALVRARDRACLNVTRVSEIVPGFDCIYGDHCVEGGMGRTGPGNHGIHGDEWHYTVVSADGRAALSLDAYTYNFPDTIPASHFEPGFVRKPAYGVCMSLHLAFPTSPSEVEPEDCLRLPGGKCYWRRVGGSMRATEFFKATGDGTRHEQPEHFWLNLESELALLHKEAIPELSKTVHTDCSGCGGTGKVEVPR